MHMLDCERLFIWNDLIQMVANAFLGEVLQSREL